MRRSDCGKVLSEHGELTAVVTILHDRRERSKGALYAQLQVAADELERGFRRPPRHRAAERAAEAQAIELEQASALKSSSSRTCRTSSDAAHAMLGYTSMLLQGSPAVQRRQRSWDASNRTDATSHDHQ